MELNTSQRILLHIMASPLRVLSNIVSGVILLLDENGVVIDYKTEKSSPLFGRFDSSLEKSIWEVLPPYAHDGFLDAMEKTKETGVKKTSFVFHWLLGDKKLWFEVRFSRLDEGHFLVLIEDITEEKEREAHIRKQSRWFSALRAVEEAITSAEDLQFVLSTLLFHLSVQLKIDAANILRRDGYGNELKSIAEIGFRPAAFVKTGAQVGVGYAGKAALEGRVVYVPDLSAQEGGFPGRFDLTRQDEFIAYYAIPLKVQGSVEGVLEVFQRSSLQLDVDDINLLEMFAKQAAIAIERSKLSDYLKKSLKTAEQAYDATIKGWAQALNLRDKETEEHTCRVTGLALALAKMMNVPKEKLIHLQRGAILHDIGKLGIPDSILLKPGALTDKEWEIMRMHPQYAFNILSSIAYLKPALDIPYYHHEKWDGSGYPHGLKETQIPLAARIFSVADVYDALTSDRPYRKAWSYDQAREYIRRNAGLHFDPDVVACFTRLTRKKDFSVPDTILKCNWMPKIDIKNQQNRNIRSIPSPLKAMKP